MSRRAALTAIAVAVAADLLLRARLARLPLNTDEGGFAYVAHLWSTGSRLYGDDAWVDRPQGLLVLYRIANALGDEWAIRSLALAAGALTTIAVATAAWALAGPRAGAIAGGLYGVLSPAPHLEGFASNGELLASGFATTSVAAAAWWTARGDRRLLALAGICAGAAPLVKQSALDAGVVLATVLVLALARREVRPADVLVAALGVALPVAAALAHAASVGVGDWWYAVAGYRAGTESALSGDRLHRLRLLYEATGPAVRDVGVLVAALPLGLIAMRRARLLALPGAWLAGGAVGFLAGGLYHPHYWLGLAPALAAVAGVGLARAPRSVAVGACVLTALSVALSLPVYTATPRLASLRSSDDVRLLSAPAVGRYVRDHADPDDRLQVIWANAAVYYYAGLRPGVRELWYRGIEFIPGARARARERFAGSDPPRFVAVYHDPGALDETGTVQRVLDERYDLVATIDGVPIYRLR